MSNNAFRLSIAEIKNADHHWQQTIIPYQHLHYCPASAGSWGILRVALLVPESAMLLVAPAACGRHGAIAGIQLGFKKNLFLLHVDEIDIVSGQHLDKIPQAVAEILVTTQPRPKAMIICATCIDDLLGSDYDALAQQLEASHGIPVRICRMVPTAHDGKSPPAFAVQQTMYDFLEKSVAKNRAVNIVGSYAPIDAESEFYKVMGVAGFGKIRHVAYCATFHEFRRMGDASHNILIRPNGRLAVEQMERKLGIPHCSAPVAYGLGAIAQTYRTLEEFLGTTLNTEKYHEEAQDTVKKYRKELGPLSVAIGSTVNGSPFELARALTGYGFQVRYIFADQVFDFDREHVDWLKQHNAGIEVFTNIHPTMANFIEHQLTVDVALGFDAGYFCPGSKTVPLLPDQQPFGYQCVSYLFREIVKALENPQSHKEQMFASGTVI